MESLADQDLPWFDLSTLQSKIKTEANKSALDLRRLVLLCNTYDIQIDQWSNTEGTSFDYYHGPQDTSSPDTKSLLEKENACRHGSVDQHEEEGVYEDSSEDFSDDTSEDNNSDSSDGEFWESDEYEEAASFLGLSCRTTS